MNMNKTREDAEYRAFMSDDGSQPKEVSLNPDAWDFTSRTMHGKCIFYYENEATGVIICTTIDPHKLERLLFRVDVYAERKQRIEQYKKQEKGEAQ